MPILRAETNLFPDELLDSYTADQTESRWWVVYTMSRQEKSLARDLLGMQTPFYLPLTPRKYVRRGRRIESRMPIFTGYLFMFATEDQRVDCLKTNRISSVLPVSDAEELRVDLKKIHSLVAAGAELTVEKCIQPGQLVRVKSGPFADMDGVVIERRGQTRLLVAVRYLQQGVSMQIDDFMVESL